MEALHVCDVQQANADWFCEAGWGVFTHYLGSTGQSAEEWNRQIDQFDVIGLADQLAGIGTKYYFITIGQGSGHFCAPNETYDSLVGECPSKLSRRDLIAELADVLTARGIRLMVYLPSHAPFNDLNAIERLQCTPTWDCSWWSVTAKYQIADGIDERLSVFQRNWEAIIREWSLRWGDRVHGWWIDGCYYADRMYQHEDAPNFRSFAAAMKAGNPQSLVAFNPGVRNPIIRYTPYEDYTAGESDGLPFAHHFGAEGKSRWIDGAQFHVLSYLGDWWGDSTPRFPDELVVGYTKYITQVGGVVTWDVPITPQGHIPEAFVHQLGLLRGIHGNLVAP